MAMADKEEKEAASSESDDDLAEEDNCSDVETEPTAQNSSEILAKNAQLQTQKPNQCISINVKPAKPKVKRKKKRWLTVNLSNCKYDCVRRSSKKFGFREVNDEEDFNLFWTDSSVSLERVMDMKKYQKINHFPGMSEICRKDCLARNMNRLWKQFPKDYSIFPQTWCLPADYGDFLAFSRQKKNKTFIVKPDCSSQGRGIFLTKNPKQDVKPGEDVICQQYVSKPFLIDGFKFDLRIYAVVTSCDPLRIFIFKDGLVRFATVKYVEPVNNNLENVYIHLTNYSINKSSEDFIRDEETGSKRRISTLNKWFVDNGYNIGEIWARIDDIIIKTLITAHPILKHNYRTCFPNHNKGSGCFEILGFDVLLDKKLKPWVIEVNHSPSFSTDSKLDREIKDALVYDTLRLLNFSLCGKKKCIEEEKRKVRERLLQKPKSKEQKAELDTGNTVDLEALTRYEDKHIGNFRRIYPQNGCEEKYAMYFENSCSLFQETAASKARSECARIQREEIKQKSQEIDNMRKKNAGKKLSVDGIRPESPRPRRKRIQNGFRFVRKCDKQAVSQKCFDSNKPMPINEEEELERLGAMLQRDNLIRSLGVVELVYRLLHGSGSLSKSSEKIIKCEKLREEPQSTNLQVFRKQRPQSTTQSITIRSYLGRFLAQQPVPSAGLNPIVTPAVASDRIKQAVSDQQTLTQTQSNRKMNFLPFGISPSSLHRPKIGARKPPIPSRNALEQEITSISRGIELDVSRISKQQKPTGHQHHGLPFNIEGVETIDARLSSFEAMSPPHGPILPCQAYSNLSRYSKDAPVGLSIVSTPAPVQYKEDSGAKQHVGVVSAGALEVSGTCSKSTRAQRVRGASNSMRLKQMGLVENRAMALS